MLTRAWDNAIFRSALSMGVLLNRAIQTPVTGGPSLRRNDALAWISLFPSII